MLKTGPYSSKVGRLSPHMGDAEYPSASYPLGWDYDTLRSAARSIGVDIDQVPEDKQLQLMDLLEMVKANTEELAGPIIKEFVMGDTQSADPFNQATGTERAQQEDGPGYWDAAHRGDGKGSSFIGRPNPEYGQDNMSQAGWDAWGSEDMKADPVGNGPDYGGGNDAIMAAAAGKQTKEQIMREYLQEMLMKNMAGRGM